MSYGHKIKSESQVIQLSITHLPGQIMRLISQKAQQSWHSGGVKSCQQIFIISGWSGFSRVFVSINSWVKKISHLRGIIGCAYRAQGTMGNIKIHVALNLCSLSRELTKSRDLNILDKRFKSPTALSSS